MSKENFFDFREKMSAKPSPPKTEPMTVTQLTSQIEKALKAGVPGSVFVKGEASNLNLHRASGHLYFTLKDAGACIDCVMFKSEAAKLKFTPEDGMELLVTGRVAIYPQRGRYQLYATNLQPLGRGALELAFRQLSEKLQKEGLFDAERKKPLPRFPTKIALVTSQSTAALQDMLKVLRRYPWIGLMLYHVPVQGDGSAELIADAIVALNKSKTAQVILLARGGGSLEDLWEFNEEIVARAVAASKIPIITGIGHEVDVSIADLAADYHAHTPTEAAQVITTNWKIVKDQLNTSSQRLLRGLRTITADARHRLTAVLRHDFFRRPTERINQFRQLLDDRQRAMHIAVSGDLKRQIQRIDLLDRHLQAISPQAVLSRGYSITSRKKDGAIIRSSKETRIGERLVTRLADGTVESTVQDQKQLPLFE